MSRLFAVLMATADEAILNYKYIKTFSLETRMAFVVGGGVQPRGVQKEVEKLFSSIDQKIPALIKLLPLVENDPKYEYSTGWQLRIDTKFDRFLKSKLPESYFRKRYIDLASLAEGWNEVIYMEDRLLYLLTVTIPRQIKRLAAKSKAAREISNGQNQVVNTERVNKLKGDIKKTLEADPKTISGDSKVITPEVVSRWQKQWETKLSDLVKRYSDWSQEDFVEALEWTLKSIETSKEMVAKRIFPAEVELSQIDYWLNRIFDPQLSNRDSFGSSGQKLKEEVERNISAIFKTLPALWVNGELEIQELENGESFLKGKYPSIVIDWVDSAMSEVNWDFHPGYNDNVQTPFLNQKLLEPTHI